MDDDAFIEFLAAEGYDRDAARTLVSQVYDEEIGDDGFLEIKGRNGTVVIEIDAWLGFAGILYFNVAG